MFSRPIYKKIYFYAYYEDYAWRATRGSVYTTRSNEHTLYDAKMLLRWKKKRHCISCDKNVCTPHHDLRSFRVSNFLTRHLDLTNSLAHDYFYKIEIHYKDNLRVLLRPVNKLPSSCKMNVYHKPYRSVVVVARTAEHFTLEGDDVSRRCHLWVFHPSVCIWSCDSLLRNKHYVDIYCDRCFYNMNLW